MGPAYMEAGSNGARTWRREVFSSMGPAYMEVFGFNGAEGEPLVCPVKGLVEAWPY